MKLNYKRVIFVGFAFFLICSFWAAYDAIMPLMLVNQFGMSQTASGVIMALDNILALFLLPLFGALSDKSKSKRGKRTPYIILGTVVAIVSFMGLSFVDNVQLHNITYPTQTEANQVLWDKSEEEDWQLSNAEYSAFSSFANSKADSKYSLHDYAAMVKFNSYFTDLNETQKAATEQWFVAITHETTYLYDKTTNSYIADSEAISGVVGSEYKEYNAYSKIVVAATNKLAFDVTMENPAPLVCFVLMLLVVLVSMSVFRSPAVALMPDVVVKPLRSKANAIINLMGTAGGIVILLLGFIFGTGKAQNQIMSYTGYIAAVCGVMAFGLLMFLLKVREPRWAKEMHDESVALGLETEGDENCSTDETTAENCSEAKPKAKATQKISAPEMRSLIFILLSVAFWYMGYNAVTSKYSIYAVNVLQKDYTLTLMVAQIAAIAAFIPIGIISSKLGRKRVILAGVLILAAAFIVGIFASTDTPVILLYLMFAAAGIGWASINVNSFPMVVELSKGGDVGKYTGFYYTASMAAQIVTPMLSGFIMDSVGNMAPLFPYAAICVLISFVTMLFVKHGDSKPEKKQLIENFNVDD